jgi:hypothetical protein
VPNADQPQFTLSAVFLSLTLFGIAFGCFRMFVTRAETGGIIEFLVLYILGIGFISAGILVLFRIKVP